MNDTFGRDAAALFRACENVELRTILLRLLDLAEDRTGADLLFQVVAIPPARHRLATDVLHAIAAESEVRH